VRERGSRQPASFTGSGPCLCPKDTEARGQRSSQIVKEHPCIRARHAQDNSSRADERMLTAGDAVKAHRGLQGVTWRTGAIRVIQLPW